MKRRHGDRRVRPRFEVVGDLWGTVETVLRLPLKNVGLNGALIESPVPLAEGSIHRIGWDVDGSDMSAEVLVRHVSRIKGADGEHTYMVGVEFVSSGPALAEYLQRWLTDDVGAAGTSGA